MIFDTHCHLNSEELFQKIDEVISSAKEVGVEKFLVVGYNKETSLLAIEIAKKYDFCYATIGFHPTEVFDLSEEEYTSLLKLASKENKVVAIGEIGLDYHWVSDIEQKEIEKEFFIKQIEFANEVGLPISIHNRESTDDCLKILKEHTPKHGFIMHCFSGSIEVMNEILKMDNSYISLGGPVTFTNAKTPKQVAKEIPLERLLVETDAPYLTPHPYRGTMNEPKYISLIIDEISKIKNLSRKEIEDATFFNACKVLKINK